MRKMRDWHHPNLIEVYGITEGTVTQTNNEFTILHDNSQYLLVSEYCPEGPLSACLKQCKEGKVKFDEERSLHWMINIIDAMIYLHSRKILHRDLKPSNIFLSSNMTEVKVGDSGMARKVLKRPASDEEGNFGNISSTFLDNNGAGAVYFTAPEVFQSGQLALPGDVFSFAMVIFALFLQHDYLNIYDSSVILGDAQPTKYVEIFISKFIRGLRPTIQKSANSQLSADTFEFIHQLIIDCWQHNYKARPTFEVIKTRLETFRKNRVVPLVAPISPGQSENPFDLAIDEFTYPLQPFNKAQTVFISNYQGMPVILYEVEASRVDEVYAYASLTASSTMPLVKVFGVLSATIDNSTYRKFVAVEFIPEATSLAELLVDRNAALSEYHKVTIAREIALAIAVIHDNGILHQHLHTKNILVSFSSLGEVVVKIGGFIPKLVASNRAGTLIFTAPETLQSSTHQRASDVYSFGMILYCLFVCNDPVMNLLSGEELEKCVDNAFSNAVIVDKIANEQQRPYIPLESENIMQSMTSDIVTQLIQKCWSAEPKDRPTIQAIVNSFKHIQPESLSFSDMSWQSNRQEKLQNVADVQVKQQAVAAADHNVMTRSVIEASEALLEPPTLVESQGPSDQEIYVTIEETPLFAHVVPSPPIPIPPTVLVSTTCSFQLIPIMQRIQSELGYADETSLQDSVRMAIVDLGLEEQCNAAMTTKERVHLQWDALFGQPWESLCTRPRISTTSHELIAVVNVIKQELNLNAGLKIIEALREAVSILGIETRTAGLPAKALAVEVLMELGMALA